MTTPRHCYSKQLCRLTDNRQFHQMYAKIQKLSGSKGADFVQPSIS